MTMSRRRWIQIATAPGLAPLLVGCAGMPGMEAPRVTIVGLERLNGEGFEIRFSVKLRIQNANSTELTYDGIVLDLDVNGRPLASGVSDAKGTIPRFGNEVLSVPVSVHAIGVIRQLLGLASDSASISELPYSARGRLGGGWHPGARFSAEGVLKLPQ